MAVSVDVGVIVGVSEGRGVMDGVKVTVGVGVSVANKGLSGWPGPLSHMISRMSPPSTSTPAAIEIILGLISLFFRGGLFANG